MRSKTRSSAQRQPTLPLLRECVGILLRALYPIAPHITHALWNELGYAARVRREIIDAPWPQADQARCDRTRSSWSCRSTASCAHRSACRRSRRTARSSGAAIGRRQRAEVRRRPAGEARRSSCPASSSTSSSDATASIRLRRWRCAIAPLAACGFKLRGAQTLPVETIYLALAGQLADRRRDVAPAARVDQCQSGAPSARTPRRSSNCSAKAASARCWRSTAQGRATEYQLRLRVRFRVLDKNGLELIAPTD